MFSALGLRSTGKVGNDAYTLLVVDDRGGGSVIIPSTYGSEFANQEFSSIAAIGRLRHDFLKSSFVSFLAALHPFGVPPASKKLPVFMRLSEPEPAPASEPESG
jgi:hypothetical protein